MEEKEKILQDMMTSNPSQDSIEQGNITEYKTHKRGKLSTSNVSDKKVTEYGYPEASN